MTADRGSRAVRASGIEINDHPRQNSAYRHLNMKGAFENEGALRFYISWSPTDSRVSDIASGPGRTRREMVSARVAARNVRKSIPIRTQFAIVHRRSWFVTVAASRPP